MFLKCTKFPGVTHSDPQNWGGVISPFHRLINLDDRPPSHFFRASTADGSSWVAFDFGMGRFGRSCGPFWSYRKFMGRFGRSPFRIAPSCSVYSLTWKTSYLSVDSSCLRVDVLYFDADVFIYVTLFLYNTGCRIKKLFIWVRVSLQSEEFTRRHVYVFSEYCVIFIWDLTV